MRQRLLMPMLVELKASQMVVFAGIADELERNGFEVEPFGPQTLAVKAAPVGLEGAALERMLARLSSNPAPIQTNLRIIMILRLCARALPLPSPVIPPLRSIPRSTRFEWNGY